jgi:hypothetical protein
VRRRRAGENEDTGADDAPDTERHNAQRPERLAKRVLTRFFDDGGYRLSRHQTMVCHGETFPSIVGTVACQLPQPNSFARVIAGENEIFTLVQCGGLAVAA